MFVKSTYRFYAIIEALAAIAFFLFDKNIDFSMSWDRIYKIILIILNIDEVEFIKKNSKLLIWKIKYSDVGGGVTFFISIGA